MNLNQLNVVYNDAGEQEIRAVVLYVKTSKIYADAAGKIAVPRADVLEFCMKNMVTLFDTDTYYSVKSFKDAGGTLTLAYGDAKTATAQ